MKIKVIRAKLIEGLNLVKDACEGKEKLNILTNIKIEATTGDAPGQIPDEEFGRLVLTASNLSTQIEAVVPCKIEKKGAACLVGRRFVDFVSALPDGEVEIELNSTGTKAIISGGECVYTLAAINGSEFPIMSKPEDGKDNTVFLYLQAPTIKELLRKVKYASSTDGQRKALEGVNVEMKDGSVIFRAADGKRLSVCEYKCEVSVKEPHSFTFPNKAIAQLFSLLDKCEEGEEIEISCNGRNSRIVSKRWMLGAKMIEDIYPNLEKAIPDETQFSVEIDREKFLEEVKRANLASDKESLAVKITFDNGKVTFEGRDCDVSKYRSNIPAKYIGEKIYFWMNARLLKDVLGGIDDNDVTISFNGLGTPMVIKCSIPFLGVIMPLRID